VADGISVGAGLSASALLGSVSALLVLVHKLPEGIAAMSALYHAGVAARRAGWITAGLASVTPLAVLVSFFILRGVSANALGILLALSGGSFLYVGAADLLPEGQAHGRPANTGAFLLGGGVMAVVKLVA
jgi:ZIP family zinc transporter